LLLLVGCAPAPAASLQGTDLDKTPAPDFQLTDSTGRPFRLSDQKGKAVALTFLYTNCPDECPLIAERMRETYGQLGTAADSVRFVAVSLDPERDTSAAIQSFLAAHHVEGVLTYLRGMRAELGPVWRVYFLSVLPGTSPGVLAHQSRIVVIDRAGLERSNFGADVTAAALANDLRIALSEPYY
jgi:protein SCO1/2